MHSSIWDPQVYTRLSAPKVLTGSSRVCSVDQMGSQVGQAEGWLGKCQNGPSGPKTFLHLTCQSHLNSHRRASPKSSGYVLSSPNTPKTQLVL